MPFRMNWETSKERQKSRHFRSLPRTGGWTGVTISAKHCLSLNELKTSGKTLPEAGSELYVCKSGWLSPKASQLKSFQEIQDRTTPDKSCSSSHFEVGEPNVQSPKWSPTLKWSTLFFFSTPKEDKGMAMKHGTVDCLFVLYWNSPILSFLFILESFK